MNKHNLFLLSINATEIAGYWWWTWGSSTSAPPGTTLGNFLLLYNHISFALGIAFNGYSDPSKALKESSSLKSKLPGLKFISVGGGDADGRFTSTIVKSITSSINAGSFAGYNGIAYDIEEGDSGLSDVRYLSTLSISHSHPRFLPLHLRLPRQRTSK
jgi:hypothetical protein